MRMILGFLAAVLVAVAGCAPTEFVDPYGAQASRKPSAQDNAAGK
ncbi:MAG TPA: hypothetical protein VD995_07395 [Azospirillum sp.]|nr:hypothetical protein [Azospirillum sp.]